MRAARLRLALCLVLGCGSEAGSNGQGPGGPPSGSGPDTCTSTADCDFGERCESGVCTSEVPPPIIDERCDDDGDCAQGEACALSSGLCVPQVLEPTPGPDPVETCAEGEMRRCGDKLGACEYGVQSCQSGEWQACQGGIGPAASESCNGIDDDCDGVLPAAEVDGDGDGQLACAGDCAPDLGTSYLGAPEVCDGLDNDCDGAADDGAQAACDDGLFCNGVETCSTGACRAGADIDCSSLSDTCHLGTCSEAARDCVAEELSDGTPCTDANLCTVATTCASGVCGGGAILDCSGQNDPCNAGACEPATGACIKQPYTDSRGCDDGFYCTTGETCSNGSCGGGTARVCGDVGSCLSGNCDEDSDSCVDGSPINQGLACDDGQYCTVGETCNNGSCGGGTARSCAALADQCSAGVCDPALGACKKQPYADGRACDDGAFCSSGDTCQPNGTCTGSARDCSSLTDSCNLGVCSESADACQRQPRNEGGACSDGLYCTVGDSCAAGTCGGLARNCAGVADACNSGVCNETGDRCDKAPRQNGTLCDDGLFCTVSDSCQSGACSAGTPRDCSSLSDPPCVVGTCNETSNVCVAQNLGTCTCDPAVDADFDGADECDDCDDTNGSIRPGATERCNGLDDDCDGLRDETFDADGDGYSVCTPDPALRDCDDTRATVSPGDPEACGTAGTGNSLDDNCNGYVDEGCAPCSSTDPDLDGFSQCQGDCAPSDGAIAPGKTELCDGKDNDCNTFTTENCGVSDPCNWPDGNDVCRADLLCACSVNNSGACTGNYICTSLCNSSETGPVGDGCAVGQACFYDLLRSANVHGCAATDTVVGTKEGGVACAADTECRSGYCEMFFTGSGQKTYCSDFCGSDAYCATSAVCRAIRSSTNLDGRCWPMGRPGLGASTVGQSCTQDSTCDHGVCTTVAGGTAKICTEPCCSDTDCGAGFTCSLQGDQVSTTYVYPPPGAPACTGDAQCPTGMMCYTGGGVCAWRLTETTPMCVPDVSSQGTRRAGAACALNRECQSNFCERTLGVCVETCCSDATCPDGLSCEYQVVQTTADRASQARICVNQSSDAVFLRK